MSAPTEKVRKAVYARDFNRCVRCGETALLTFQHRAAVGNGGSKIRPLAAEGIAACIDCNVRFEQDLQAVALSNGWKVRRWVQGLGRVADVPVFYACENAWFRLDGRTRVHITAEEARDLMRDVYGIDQYDQQHTLRDVDNRGPDGEPFETTGTIEQLAAYIDGPLRSDLTAQSDLQIDTVVSEMRAGRLSRWHRRDLETVGVRIGEVTS